MVNFKLRDFWGNQTLPVCILWDHSHLASLDFLPVTSQFLLFFDPRDVTMCVSDGACCSQTFPQLQLFTSELVLPALSGSCTDLPLGSLLLEQDFCYLCNISCKFLALQSTFKTPGPDCLHNLLRFFRVLHFVHEGRSRSGWECWPCWSYGENLQCDRLFWSAQYIANGVFIRKHLV